MSVRRATEADGAAIASIQRRTWQATYRGVFPDEVLDGFDVGVVGERWAAAAAEQGAGHAVLVFEREGEVVGFASVAPVADEAGVGELETLYVAPDEQRRGIGARLLAGAAEALTASGHTRALLWVVEANRGARAFYEDAGWICDGARKTWRGADVVCYRRRL